MSEKIDEIKTLLRRPSWTAWGIAVVMALCFILLVICGCGRDGEAHGVTEISRLKERLATIELVAMEEDRLRQAAEIKVSEYLTFGALVAENKNNLSERYLIGKAISQYSDETGLAPRLVAAIMKIESNGRLRAVSHKGARGLMQVMPDQARRHGFACDLYEVECNVRVGTAILAANIKRWGYVEGIERYNKGTRKLRGLDFYFKVKTALESFEKRDSLAGAPS